MAITLYNQNIPRIRGVLFDMDGLVLDTEKLYCRFWAEAGRLCGFPMTMDHALAMRSLGAGPGEAKLQSFFGPDAHYITIRKKRVELMEAYLAAHGIEVKPGIYELLDALDARGIPAAITSSSSQEIIRQHLEVHNLYHRFAKICSGHDVANGKPAPDIYLLGAASLDLNPEECLALEDSPTGILAAYRAGCMAVMVPDLDQPDSDTEKLLFAKADSLSDVISLLE